MGSIKRRVNKMESVQEEEGKKCDQIENIDGVLEKTIDDKCEKPTKEKSKFPKSVFFIIGTEGCERFTNYGNRAILALYLNQILRYSEDSSTVIFNVFDGLGYAFPILGAILADSFLGKFRVILYLCILYAIGNVTLAIGAIGDSAQGIPGLPAAAISFLGLLLISLGTGGIKPCVSTLGAEQFQLPEQQDMIDKYF